MKKYILIAMLACTSVHANGPSVEQANLIMQLVVQLGQEQRQQEEQATKRRERRQEKLDQQIEIFNDMMFQSLLYNGFTSSKDPIQVQVEFVH